MSLSSIPQLIQHRRDTLNGHYPSATFYRRVTDGMNHLTAYRHKQVFGRSVQLGDASYGAAGTNTIARWRFRSGHGAKYARIILVLGRDNTGGVAGDPTVSVTIGGTTSGPHAWGQSPTATDDAPDDWRIVNDVVDITPNTAYSCSISAVDYARVLAVAVYELGDETIDEATDYYSGEAFGADSPIFDASQERILGGLSNLWRHNGGTVCHWGRRDGSARTRTSATAANLPDGSTTGAPSAATPGWTLDLTYRATEGRATVPVEIAAYGAMSAGSGVSGTVVLVDSGGTTVATVTVNSNTAGWFTTAALLPATVDKYDLKFASDGVNTLSVYAVSLNEWEA